MGYLLFSSPFFFSPLFGSCGRSFYPCPWLEGQVRDLHLHQDRQIFPKPGNLPDELSLPDLLVEFVDKRRRLLDPRLEMPVRFEQSRDKASLLPRQIQCQEHLLAFDREDVRLPGRLLPYLFLLLR